MSVFRLIADVVSSDSCFFFVFKVLKLKVVMLTMFLHLSWAWALYMIFRSLEPEIQPRQNALLVYSRVKGDVVWISHGNLSLAVFIFLLEDASLKHKYKLISF